MRNRFHCSSLVTLAIAVAAILPTVELVAAPVDEKKLNKVVETWVRHVTAHKQPQAIIARMEPYKQNDVTMAYVVHLAGGGYCLAGADSLVLPVYWYSPNGKYDPHNPELRVLLEEIATRSQYLRDEMAKGGAALQAHQDALARRAAFWEELSAGRVPANSLAPQGANAAVMTDASVLLELPLTSQWSQVGPYNDQCPDLPPGSGNHTLVGCVGTAMAQVMYYWRWPITGVGSANGTYSYRSTNVALSEPLANDPVIPTGWAGRLWWASNNLNINGNWDESIHQSAIGITNDAPYQAALQTLWTRLTQGQTTFSANFGATTYQWNLLQDVHPSPVPNGDAEVAKLCFHAGVAANMGYGLNVSGSGSDIFHPLVNNFRYDPDAVLTNSDVNRMVEEIRWMRPILMGGYGPLGGHEWVVYGSNLATSPWQFRMNLGWGPDSSGWYSVDNIPEGYNDYQDNVIRTAPLNVVRFVGASVTGDGSPSNPHKDIQEALGAAPDGATLIFKAGSLNTFSAAQLVINRPLTLKGLNVTISK
jgi:hypothetical protein